jgi:RNA polymerase sigma-70 factor (ECF subfamily)
LNRPVHTHPEQETALLLQCVAAGEEKAFEQLFISYKDRVYEIALLYTESAFLAEEILQDIFVQVWQKRAGLPSVSDFSSWIFILTRNRSFNVLRDIARASTNNRLLAQHFPVTGAEAADARLLSSEAGKLVQEAMERLTPAQRQAFELFKLKGFSREETALQMGISPNTVKVHLLQAMRTIRAFFIEKDLFIPAVSAGLIIIS